MIKKIKSSLSEKILFTFLISLAVFTFGSFYLIKNKCLFIKNYEPERWPAGDPPLYGDVDAHMLHYDAPTKIHMLKNKNSEDIKPLFDLAFSKRPEYELYNIKERLMNKYI